MAGGRPPKWKTLAAFNKSVEGFWEWNEENDYIPDVEGLCLYIETSRKVLMEYEEKDEFSNTIKEIKSRIAFHKKQLALKGKIPAAIFCFDFHNNHGYQHREVIIEKKEPEVNLDELKKEIRELVKENGFNEQPK